MARLPESWRLVWRRGVARVRFRHEDRRLEITTGTKDPSLARERAAQIYAEVVQGSRRSVSSVSSTQPLKHAVAAWLTSLASQLDRRTVREYGIYAKAHWLTRWSTLGDVSERSIGEYQRERLARVTRVTLRKELSALRGLLRWCVELGALRELPTFPALPRQAMGTRVSDAKERVVLTEREVQRLLKALPSGRSRDYVEFAWETGLRPATIFRLKTPTHWEQGRKKLRLTGDVDKARFARELPLTAKALAVLERCTPTARGKLFAWRDVVVDDIRDVSLKVLHRRVGLYDLRHSRITLWVNAGGPLTGVQYLAGHKHLSTTARYAHAGLKAAEEALAATVGPGPRRKRKSAA